MPAGPRGSYDTASGVWSHFAARAGAFAGRPALFLDRDGTVLEEVHYLHTAAETKLMPGAADVIAAANARRIAVVIVTNQAGIGRGAYDWPDFEIVQDKMAADLAAAGARVDASLACPFHAEGQSPYQHPNHPARKPGPEMLVKAFAELGCDPALSWIVGNRASDLVAGRAAGCAGGMHVRSGLGAEDRERDDSLALANDSFAVLTGETIADCLTALPLLIG